MCLYTSSLETLFWVLDVSLKKHEQEEEEETGTWRRWKRSRDWNMIALLLGFKSGIWIFFLLCCWCNWFVDVVVLWCCCFDSIHEFVDDVVVLVNCFMILLDLLMFVDTLKLLVRLNLWICWCFWVMIKGSVRCGHGCPNGGGGWKVTWDLATWQKLTEVSCFDRKVLLVMRRKWKLEIN